MTNRPQRRVLAADADPSALRHIEACLEGESFSVVTAAHGRETLRALREDATFAAAILSHDLPGISGLELLKRVKAGARLSRVPVVMTLEAGGDHVSRVACLSAGAAGCLPQPLAKWQLLSLLRPAAETPAGDDRSGPRDDRRHRWQWLRGGLRWAGCGHQPRAARRLDHRLRAQGGEGARDGVWRPPLLMTRSTPAPPMSLPPSP